MTQALDRVRKAARQRKKGQFTRAPPPHQCRHASRTAFYALKRKAAAGVDGVTWHDYEADLEPQDRGSAWTGPPGSLSTATVAPDVHTLKADGESRGRSLIATLEDKVVQGATVMALNAIYEGDFCGFSYGFRPGRGPHDALDALSTAIKIRKSELDT